MKDIIAKSLLSTLVCAYVISLTGCGVDDRAIFKSDIKEKGTIVNPNGDDDKDKLTNQEEADHGTDPKNPDTDGDGLKDGDEVNKYHTDPLDPDTDDDGLGDGLEVAKNPDNNTTLLIGTSAINADTDNDGVTDGIEVLGTYKDNIAEDGKVVTAGENKVPLKVGENGLKVLDINPAITVADWGDRKPANIHKNNTTDPQDEIDALDPMNDSDYDKRPNVKEKEKKTDPLDQNSKYLFIYETPEGQKMEAAGFTYVPAIDERGGFWMSRYEARKVPDTSLTLSNIDSAFIASHFHYITGDPASGYDNLNDSGIDLYKVKFTNVGDKMVGMYAFEAAFILDNSQVEGSNTTIKLPSLRQLEHALRLVNYNNDNIVRNSIYFYDANVEEDYPSDNVRGRVFELKTPSREFTNTLITLQSFVKPDWMTGEIIRDGDFAINGSKVAGDIGATAKDAVAIKDQTGTKNILLYSISYGDNGANAIGFHATSDYIK